LVLGIEMSRLARSCRDWQRARIPWLATAVLVVLAPYFERGRAGAELPVDDFNSPEAVDYLSRNSRILYTSEMGGKQLVRSWRSEGTSHHTRRYFSGRNTSTTTSCADTSGIKESRRCE